MITNFEKIVKCDKQLKDAIDLIDKKFKDIYITSGYRSPEENAKLPNASKTSLHMDGLAVDFRVPNVDILILAGELMKIQPSLGFSGLGIDIYQNYLHMDWRGGSLVRWVYGKGGKEA